MAQTTFNLESAGQYVLLDSTTLDTKTFNEVLVNGFHALDKDYPPSTANLKLMAEILGAIINYIENDKLHAKENIQGVRAKADSQLKADLLGSIELVTTAYAEKLVIRFADLLERDLHTLKELRKKFTNNEPIKDKSRCSKDDSE